MVHCLIADIQTVANATEPINQCLSRLQVVLVWLQVLNRAAGIYLHLLQGTSEGNLSLVAYVALPDAFHEFSTTLQAVKNGEKLLSFVAINCAFLLTSR